jgi:hypothetical protein
MTVANLVSSSSTTPTSQTRRARLAAAANPVLAGPSTSAVALGEGSVGEFACVTLANPQLRLDVAPSLGGGITRFDWRSDGALVPIFRRCRHVAADTDPNQLACYPMLPYSNRIGGGHFGVGGRRVDVPRNRAAEPLPIHGDGWLAHWQVAETDQDKVRLTLDRSDGKPYAYRATQTYALEGPSLVITLEVENTGRDALPFGLGIHPFLVRDAQTELSAAAAGLAAGAPCAGAAGLAVRRGLSVARDDRQSRLYRLEWAGGRRLAQAAAVTDHRVGCRLLRALHAARRRLFLLRAGRSSDQCDEPAGGRGVARHDNAGARRAPLPVVSLHRRADGLARVGWGAGFAEAGAGRVGGEHYRCALVSRTAAARC